MNCKTIYFLFWFYLLLFARSLFIFSSQSVRSAIRAFLLNALCPEQLLLIVCSMRQPLSWCVQLLAITSFGFHFVFFLLF